MKKAILFIFLSALTFSSFSQKANPATLTKQDYLKKSKRQKTTAWILAGGGTAMALVSLTSFNLINVFGSALDDNNSNENLKRGETTFYIGCITAVSSIPFFIASSKNKKKAASVSFKMEKTPVYQQRSFVYHSYPALSLKIPIQ
jgi:hypothetical protein